MTHTAPIIALRPEGFSIQGNSLVYQFVNFAASDSGSEGAEQTPS
jgi:hypothetical protein